MHNYCACPWCQGPRPHPKPDREKEAETADFRKRYEDLLRRLDERPASRGGEFVERML